MLEIALIIALAMGATPIIADWLKVPAKLKAWVTLGIVILLNLGNALLYGDGNLLEASKVALEQGAIAVGIYSAGKNTIQHVKKG